MTESELDEIRTAINAARQYSEDNPEGMYERLLIACIPVMQQVEEVWSLSFANKARPRDTHPTVRALADTAFVYGLDIARAINRKSE